MAEAEAAQEGRQLVDPEAQRQIVEHDVARLRDGIGKIDPAVLLPVAVAAATAVESVVATAVHVIAALLRTRFEAIERDHRLDRGARRVLAADRAVDLSVEYGNERHQYGQPIGRFQAVKHRIVRMEMDKEHSRSITYYAAWAIDNETEDAGQAVAMTKAYAGERLHEVFANDVKNHGGMGFTWDHDAHIYLKQAKAWQSYLGAPGQAYDRVADIRDYSNKTLPDYPEITTDPYQGET
jgi:hypothetical protein